MTSFPMLLRERWEAKIQTKKKLKGSMFVGLPEVAGRGGHVKDTKK